MGGKTQEIRSNHFKYHLCPSVKRGGAPRLERSVQGTEVLVRAGTQWGLGAAISATTPPTPSAEVDCVLLWKHGYTQALLPQSNIFTFGMETNEINDYFF